MSINPSQREVRIAIGLECVGLTELVFDLETAVGSERRILFTLADIDELCVSLDRRDNSG